ncbi:uncharacterized protein GIQ15_02614 [Arthroderma uncinatum]|uniref:uncharacterized protein n=1 Tax=Arthroderma uncinatum TaxID=74035 RepID=UPI00144AB541|nr:uncharacterized protein GIQ15_02614 [Arthroderma uncinatum]KAF3483290.1 hypothetical protein GIQ15_02614 [Arthroderma uncinatum]
MAASLKDLIEHLLEEISLRGDQGVSPREVLGFIDEFYSLQRQKNDRVERDGAPAARRIPKLDRPFKAKVWKWLTDHPEVSVGKDREGNSLALHDLVPPQPSDAGREPAIDPALRLASSSHHELSVFVSPERTWLSITGHEPDFTRVLPLEFALLSVIASRKEKGIVQSELVRLSGQDKRSVPKRTDLLQEKGYIEKRAIQYQAARTSLCTLNKFAGLGPGELSYDPSSTVETGTQSFRNKIIDFTVLRERLFELLREYNVITRNDLKEKMGMQDRWHGKILRRAIRKFEAIGCVRRVRAVSQYSKTMKSLHPSVMLIREPTEKDIKLFHEDSKGLMSSLERLDGDMGIDEDQEQDQDIVVDPSLEADSNKENYVVDVGRVVPQWTPDRTLPNLVFDAINQAGTRGISNINVNQATMGAFFRRPLETILSRLTSSWQHSQPLHLRHLALVRDTALHKTVYYYIHYSFGNFASLVNGGHASWDAVAAGPRGGKRTAKPPPIDAKPILDQYGFLDEMPQNLLRKGDANLRECLEVAKPAKWNLTYNDPVAVELLDGTYTVDFFRKSNSRSALERARDAGVFETDDRQLLGTRSPKQGRSDSVLQLLPPGGQNGVEDMSSRPMKRRKVVSDPYEGLTGKELLEAQGLDEGWTEYNLLLMDRPTTGVYVTPFGKRRPVGKRRGRPGKSRIAVFKSSRLKEFEWFVPQTSPEPSAMGETETTPAVEASTQAVSANLSMERRPCRPVRAAAQRQTYEISNENGDQGDTIQLETGIDDSDAEWDIETPKMAVKRRHSDISVPLPANAEATPVRRRGRPPKKRKLDGQEVTPLAAALEPSIPTNGTDSRVSDEVEMQISVRQTELETAERPGGQLPEQELDVMPSQNHQAINSQGAVAQPTTPITAAAPPSLTQGSEAVEEISDTQMKIEPMADYFENPVAVNSTQSVDEMGPDLREAAEIAITDTPDATDAPSTEVGDIKGIPKRDIRSGSIGVLRKKLLLDILHKAGGLYPMGSEMWYPFTTLWLKMKQATKPDARTVKNAMRSLIESGKAKQHTFTGRNSKGLMVRKSILSLPEITATHPKLRAMQREMLDMDPQLYLPLEVEIDPDLRKSNRGFLGYGVKLPDIDGEVNVTLHQPPARTRKQLTRAEQRWNLEGFEGWLMDFGTDGLSLYDAPVNRLESIRRLTQGRSYLDSFNSHPASGALRRRYPVSALPLSSRRYMITARSMLMSPIQTYHPSTGTFGTGAYIPRAIYRVFFKHPHDHQQIITQPDSLESILTQMGGRRFDTSRLSDPVTHQFFYNVEKVRQCETRYPEIFDMPNHDYVYINHTIEKLPETPPVEGPIRFECDTSAIFNVEPARRLTRQIAKRYQPPEVILARNFGADQSQRWPERDVYPETTRKLTQIQESKSTRDSDKTARNRKMRRLGSFPEKVAQRLMVAMVVVRTLAGGLEGRMVEWALIAPLFPEYTPKFVHDRGRTLTGKHRLQLIKMQSDFQEKFADAYEKGEVPPINFDNLESYDWEWIVEWASMNLEEPSMGRLPNLPASRSQFDTLFEIREEPCQQLDEIYQYNAPITIPRKRTLLANILSSDTFLEDKGLGRPRPPDLELLDVAKTWVRANVVTPEESYRPAEAGQTMRQFGEDLLSRAIQSLITERVISMGNKGRITPGRNFDLTEQFLGTITRRRPVESTQLKQAACFKTDVLDPALRSEGSYNVKYEAEDGDILVLINLASKRRIVLVPRDPPRNKHGLTDGGYLTRLMDKGKLRFNVEIHPVQGRYIYGNPIGESLVKAPIPKGDLGGSMMPTELSQLPKIPLWFDVHSQFVKIVWDLVISAVVGILVARPAIEIKGITRMLEPCLAEWEVRLILNWLVEARVIESVRGLEGKDAEGAGWVVSEWWWMVLGQPDSSQA